METANDEWFINNRDASLPGNTVSTLHTNVTIAPDPQQNHLTTLARRNSFEEAWIIAQARTTSGRRETCWARVLREMSTKVGTRYTIA